METRLYRGHFIIALPSFDTCSARWVPQAEVSWCQGPLRRFRFLKFDDRLPCERDAIAFALRMAEIWVDRRTQADPSTSGKRAGERGLTFAEFRDAFAALGLGLGPRTLQRSYNALDRLRGHERLSWSEARRKVERLREELKVAGGTARAARFPLTEQAWRRIG